MPCAKLRAPPPNQKNAMRVGLFVTCLVDLMRPSIGFAALELLEARFPFSDPAKQGQLDLIYAYYKNREPESAIDQAGL